MRVFVLAAVAVGSLMSATAAHATPGLGNRVYSPYVKNGVTEVEVRTGRLNGGPEEGDAAAAEKSALPKVALPPNDAGQSIKVTTPKPAPAKEKPIK